ncbi:YfhO family protein [Enterococcus sp. LJL90]
MKLRNWLLGIGSILLPLGMMMIVWASLNVAPFGDGNLLVSDTGTQYLEFIHLFKKFFEEGFSSYSFSNGIGGSIEALSGYYLISPFNLIALLFADEQMPIAIIWIMTTKIALIGGSMYFYLARHYQETSLWTLVFSTAYSFCGFVVAYSLNFMWLDALIFLPLVAYGLEKLWRRETGFLYGISLLLTIVTNYYLGYMVCIFAVLYSLYLYWLDNPQRDAWRIKVLWQRWRKFLTISIAAGLATGFILIPSLYGMLQTAKTDFSLTDFLPFPRFLFSAFSQLGMGTYNFEMRLDHLPTMYTGIIVMLLFISFFMANKIDPREKKGAAFLVGCLFASFIIELFNTVWHMFQSPAGFPYRNTFIFSFLVVRFAYEGFLHLKKDYNYKRAARTIWKSAAILSGLILIGQLGIIFEDAWFNESYVGGNFVVESLLVIWLGGLLLVLFFQQQKKIWLVLAALLTLGELGDNYRYAIQDLDYGSQKQYANYYVAQEDLVDQLTDDQPLFRINEKSDEENNGYSIGYNSYNDGFLYNFSDISSYTSTLEKDVLDTLVNLGIYSKNERRFTYVDENPVLNLLLNVRYSIKPNEIKDRTPEFVENNLYVYQNEEALGMGLLVNRSDVELKANQVIENQEKILQSLRAEVNPYFRSAELIDVDTTVEGKTTMTLKTTAAGNLFMYLPNVRWRQIDSFKVNGEEHQTDITIMTNQLFNLGYFDSQAEIVLTFKTDNAFDYTDWQIATLAQDQFAELLAEQDQFAVQLNSQRDDYLYGSVTAASDNKRLFLSIPYDGDWTVKIDGKPVTTEKVYGSFLSVLVPEGAHAISLTYLSKPNLYGGILSLSVIGLTGIYYGVKGLRWLVKRSRK